MPKRPRKLGQPQFLQFQPYRAVIGSPVRRRPSPGQAFFRGATGTGVVAALVILLAFGVAAFLAGQGSELARLLPSLALWAALAVAVFACLGGLVRLFRR